MKMPDANIPKTPPDHREILQACQPGASDELRKSILDRLREADTLDEVALGARDFLEDNGHDFDALRRFLNGPTATQRKKNLKRIAASLTAAAGLLLLLGLGQRYAMESRHRIMAERLFAENGLPVFASLEGDREFHDMMSAYRIGDVDEGLRLLARLESRHASTNDTLAYFGGWLHYLDRDYEKAIARFSNASIDSLSVFHDKSRLMEAASLCLGKNRDESRRLLKVLAGDSLYTLKREAEAILADGRLW